MSTPTNIGAGDVLLIVAQMAAHIYANVPATTVVSSVSIAVNIYKEAEKQLGVVKP